MNTDMKIYIHSMFTCICMYECIFVCMYIHFLVHIFFYNIYMYVSTIWFFRNQKIKEGYSMNASKCFSLEHEWKRQNS